MKLKLCLTPVFMRVISSGFSLQNILILLILSQNFYSQSDSLIVEHITIEKGLSSSCISSIIQDSEGYVWFAAGNGVGRYDGYSFQSYINNSEDTTSFINSVATYSYSDKEGHLWFGSFRGLEKYNRTTNSFINYLPDRSEKGEITGNFVNSMIEDKTGTFWVATGKGLFKFNKISGKFSGVQYDSGLSEALNTIYVDKDGSLWVGTSRGLDKFNYDTDELIHFWHGPEKHETASISKYKITAICEDNDGILWLGTSNGLVEFNKRASTFINYLPDPNVYNPYGVNNVHALCRDPSGLLWVGTSKGIFTFDTKLKKFIHRFNNKSFPDSYLGNDFITSVYFDRSGILWIGTLENGIYKVILRTLPYKKYFPGNINQIVKGYNGILWIQRGMEGWVKFNTKTDQISPANNKDVPDYIDKSGSIYSFQNNSQYLLKNNNSKITRYNLLKETSVFYFDADRGLWYGPPDGGLYYVDFTTGKTQGVVNTETIITTIFKDSSGLVWAANYNGSLICYDTKRHSVSEFFSDPKKPSSISGSVVFTIYQDKKGRLWFGTGWGLNLFVSSTKTFIHYAEKEGLSGNIVNNILEDDHGNLWIGTDHGISKFNPETKQFKNFDDLHGLSTSHWWNRLAVKMDNGEMFFGRSYGLIRFFPDSIKENTYIPLVAITSFRLFDKTVPFGKDIELTYDKNFISFEFVTLNYYNSERNQYAYKMEGIDKDWVYSGTRRYASYPNMAPGNYIFRVKGSNNDGIWNEKGTSIKIIITPPWWKTTWAYVSYGFIFVLTLFRLRRYELNRVKVRDKIKMDEAVLKEREETDKIKSRFFANISHEFRTPLTLILGPIEKIIYRSKDEDTLKDAGIVKRNSKRILQLVNQLLDLSKLEAEKLKLEASKGNIVSFIKGTALSFESLSEEKDITLKIFSEKDLIELYFDREKMIKILSNILSNAFKFTRQNGKITVSIAVKPTSSVKGFVEIKIRDTGIGIPQEEIPKLFDRFYQVDSSFTKEYQGTGIGLALTKELVELHHGSIRVQSEMGRWTEVTLNFPLGRDHLTNEEIVPDEKTGKLKELLSEEDYYFPENIKNEESEIEIDFPKEEKTIILVVEDNYDMREYIKETIGEDYFIEEAVNGEQGVRKAESIIPDLIISDMMMPKMDGNELTRILKNNEKTSHIPIIILTAKSGQENKLEGLETGADDYLTKPFDIRELQIRIKNLINLRKKLQEKLIKFEIELPDDKENGSQSFQSKPVKLRSIDEKFLNKIQKIINERIYDENFSTEELGTEVGMSRAQAFRKIKALTGKSPSLYVRSIRLLKAKGMIENGEGNISEIAYSVGFSSPVYFSKCFKEEFGYSPKNFTY